jgi:hypothetical protein
VIVLHTIYLGDVFQRITCISSILPDFDGLRIQMFAAGSVEVDYTIIADKTRLL